MTKHSHSAHFPQQPLHPTQPERSQAPAPMPETAPATSMPQPVSSPLSPPFVLATAPELKVEPTEETHGAESKTNFGDTLRGAHIAKGSDITRVAHEAEEAKAKAAELEAKLKDNATKRESSFNRRTGADVNVLGKDVPRMTPNIALPVVPELSQGQIDRNAAAAEQLRRR